MTRQTLQRAAAVIGLAAIAVAAAAIISSGTSTYNVRAVFADVGGLVSGFRVRIDGAAVGKVASLTLDKQDHVVAELELDKSAAPIGRNATAKVRAADLLGEKYIELDPGNRADPAPSGSVIPMSRTGLAVELDDVLNTLDIPTRAALQELLNEQGVAFAGHGQDLAALLSTLPPSLDQTQQLLDQLGQNNAALGRLLDESGRVVGTVTQQRAPLEHLVGSAATTLQTLAARRVELGATVRRTPATLSSLRRALTALQAAAVPLGPAARGLAATAPPLTATLDQLPQFTVDAQPTLTTIRQVTPTLRKLGRQGTPVVRRLRPLTTELATFSSTLSPVTATLDEGAANLLGFIEGWARSTQARDAGGHVFRFGLTVGPQTFSSLIPLTVGRARVKRPVAAARSHARGNPGQAAGASPAATPAGGRAGPAAPRPGLSGVAQRLGGQLTQTLQSLGLGGPAGARGPGSSLQSLLGYLLK